MIDVNELRLGNYILQKQNNKISAVACSFIHFEWMQKGYKDLYPIVLKPELVEKHGFIENKKYPLLPDAHEYILAVPVQGSNKNEIVVYVKNNKECFGRAVVNNFPASNNFYHLHQLQNLYFALTGREMEIKL